MKIIHQLSSNTLIYFTVFCCTYETMGITLLQSQLILITTVEILKIWTHRNIAVIILKLEQYSFTTE